MSLGVGSRIGQYEVLGALGAGGMGEVYRARDTTLGRDVALKVLPDTWAHDPDRVARFQREAQLLATLNHPHIGAIYGIVDGGSAGAFSAPDPPHTHALVLELVDGPTLADRIAQGPMPVGEVVSIARQVAEALEAAHEKGIIHRDLKPANVKLTADGTVKVLDFGLAKLNDPNVSNVSNDPNLLTMSPTMVSPALMTGAGVILGTAAYMSPEQARGKPVDRRADIWAFGCLLFEMLAGRRPFDAGETVSDAVAAVLRGEPAWTALPADTPPRVLGLLRACLEKDPQARVSHVAVVRYELERPADPAPVPNAVSAARWRRAAPWAVASILAILATAGIVWGLRPVPAVPAVTRFSVPITSEVQIGSTFAQILAVSRDGSQIVYGGSRLHRRLLAERETKPIAETGGTLAAATSPVFSPDGRSIAFVSGMPGRAQIKRVDVGGGPATVLTDVLLTLGMSWHPSGIIYAEARRGILRVPENGGAPELLIPQDTNNPGEQSFQGPRLLPDGQTLIYAIVGASLDFNDAQIVAQRIGSAERTVLVRGGVDARYLSSGHLVYVTRGVLYAVPFDADALEVRGRPVPVIQGIVGTVSNTTGAAFYDVSDNGTLWYVPGATSAGSGRSLLVMDRSGDTQPLKLSVGSYESPRVSPDGRLVAVELADGGEQNIWVYDMSGTSSLRRLTFGGSNRYPVWSADGRRVTFQSTREGDSAIFWQLADGTGPAERLTRPAAGEAHVPESWSPGNEVLLLESRRQDVITVQMLSMRDRTLSRFGTLESAFPFGPTFSPDGRWVAYSTLLGGVQRIGVVTNAVFVEPFPPTGAKYQISKDDDGHHPVWAANGRELIYTRGPGQVALVAVSRSPSFTFGEPVPLGAGRLSLSPAQRRGHDPMPDGQRFVAAVAAANTEGVADLAGEVVLNWFEELRRLVPLE